MGWRVTNEVTRCAFAPVPSGVLGESASTELAGDEEPTELVDVAPLDAAAFKALPAAGVRLPTPPKAARAFRRFSLALQPALAGGALADASAERLPGIKRPEARLWNVSHSLSPGESWTELWTRRYHFGPVRLLDSSVYPPVFAFEVRRELLVAPPPSASKERPLPMSDAGRERVVGACGDSLRMRFVSTDALFAPTRIEERPAACGEFVVSFRPPPVEPGRPTRYAVEMRLLHVDAEGLADPPPSLQLYEREFNPAERAMTAWAIVSCNATCQEMGPRFFNADLRVRGELVVVAPPASEPPAGGALPLCTDGTSDGAYLRNRDPHWPAFKHEPWAWVPFDCSLRHFSPERLARCLAEIDASADADAGAAGGESARARALPSVRFLGESTLIDAARAWLVHLRPGGSDWFWPDRFPSGSREGGQRNEMRDLMQASAERARKGERQHVAFHEQHGTRILLSELRGWAKRLFAADEGSEIDALGAAGATVLSQAHNDAMKVSFTETKRNVFEIMRLLKGWARGARGATAPCLRASVRLPPRLAPPAPSCSALLPAPISSCVPFVLFWYIGRIYCTWYIGIHCTCSWLGSPLWLVAYPRYALRNPDRRFIWVTGPPRHYKEKHAPGHTECPMGRTSGNTRSCSSPVTNECELPVDLDNGARQLGGALPPSYRCARFHAEPHKWFAVLLYNTLDRVRRINAYVTREVSRSLGSRVAIVDYYKLVDPLAASYSVDGVHWGCEYSDVLATRDGPDQCRGLGNAVLANVLANAICNPRRQRQQPAPQPGGGQRQEAHELMAGEPHAAAVPAAFAPAGAPQERDAHRGDEPHRDQRLAAAPRSSSREPTLTPAGTSGPSRGFVGFVGRAAPT